ncbi:MAG TPA: hypothetical protein VKI44_00700, partial [Acetobacteraceae bacterium]|nr:hypothetical protein [Acetobacteraceae bacterium]
LTVHGGFSNNGTLYVDAFSGEGGSSLTVDGTLANTGIAVTGPGNLNLSATSTVSLGGLTNATGATFLLRGSAGHAADLVFTAANAFTSNGGDFELTYASPLTINNSFTNASTGTFALHDNTAATVHGGFSNNGTLYVDAFSGEGGSSLTVDGTLANTGVAVTGPGNLNLSATSTVSLGGLINATGATFLLRGSAGHAATLDLNGLASNSGTFSVGSFAVLDVASTGTLVATGGSKVDISAGSLTNLSGTTLTGGAYEADAGSTIQLPNNATVATLAASLTLKGIGSVVESLNTTTNKQVAIENTLTTIAAGGALNVLGGRSYTTANPLTDAGVLHVGGGGKIDLSAGGLANLSGTTLTSGTYVVDAGSTLQIQNNGTIVTLAADLTLNGAGSVVESLNTNASAQVLLEQTLGTIGAAGALRVLGGRGYTTANAITDDGVLQLGGGAFQAASLAIDPGGTLSGFGIVQDAVANSGTVDAAGGELILKGGFSGSGSYKIEAGATLDLTGGGALPATISGAGTLQLDNGTFTDTAAQLAGIGSVVVDAGAVLDLTGGGALPTTIIGGGKLQLDGGTFTDTPAQLANIGSVVVDAGAVLDLTGGGAPPATITGAGTLRLDGGTFTDTLAQLANIGSVVVDAGATLDLTGGGALPATITDAGTLQLDGGTYTAAALSVASGTTLGVGAGSSLVLGSPLHVDGTLINYGTVNGGGVTAVNFGSGTDRLILYPGATFKGTVVGGGANTTLELAKGSAAGTLNALGTKFINFGTVVVDPGATWTVDASASALAGTTITGNGTNTLVLISPGTFSLGGVSKFTTIDLFASNKTVTNNTVTATDTTLSGGKVTIRDGASGSITSSNTVSAAGDTALSKGKTLTYVTGKETDSFTGGFENDTVNVSATAVGGDVLTGGSGTNTLVLTSAGIFGLSGVNKFATIDLFAGDNTVTVTDTTLSGGKVTIHDGASGNNTIIVSDTSASKGKTLTYVTGKGTDSFTGGFENDTVNVSAAAVGGDVLTGGSGTNTLVLTSAGTFSLGGVSKFATVNLFASSNTVTNNTVTVTDTTLSGGKVAIHDGASGSNTSSDTISAAGDTAASTGKTLTYVTGKETNSFTGGFENDTVNVSATAVDGDVLTGGSGTNTLVLTSAGTFSLGGVSNFATVNLFASNNAVTVTDTTLSGGKVTIHDGKSGNNSITVSDTVASAGKTLTYYAGTGTDSFTGGFENDTIYAGTGLGTYNAGSGNDSFVFIADNLPTQTLNNFDVGADDLLLYGIHAAHGFDLGNTDNGMNPTVPTAIDPTIFIANASGSFTSANQRFAYDTTNGQLLYSASGSNASSTLVATFGAAPAFTASDLQFLH